MLRENSVGVRNACACLSKAIALSALALLTCVAFAVRAQPVWAHGGGFSAPPPPTVDVRLPPPPPPPPSTPAPAPGAPPTTPPTTPPAPPPQPPPTTPPGAPPPTETEPPKPPPDAPPTTAPGTPPEDPGKSPPSGAPPETPPSTPDAPPSSAPEPPPPPPADAEPAPSTPPSTPPTGKPSAPPTPGGALPPSSAPPLGTPGGGGLPGRRQAPSSALSDSSWIYWWQLERLQWLPDRAEAQRRTAVTESAPLAEVGAAGADARDGRDRPREWVAEHVGVPLLLSLARQDAALPDVRASALLALAKITNGADARQALEGALRDEKSPAMVRESAALGLGLLRRTAPGLRLAPADLAAVRRTLFEVADDVYTPERTRAFAAFGLGLLGDQGFTLQADQEGRVLAVALWSRMGRPDTTTEMTVALTTALGMQSTADVPDQVRDGLRELVVGRAVLGRRWNALERAHALTALCRLWPGGSFRDVLREVTRARAPVEMVRAAAIAAGTHSHGWSDASRAEAAPVLVRALTAAKDPWTRGLLRIALGRLLAAQMESGLSGVLVTETGKLLLADAQKANEEERGYALLALALAARPVVRGADAPEWARGAEALALEGVSRAAEDDALRAAYAVALGLLGTPAGSAEIEKNLAERGLGPRTRSAGAVALGQIGLKSPAVVRTLVLTLMDRRTHDLRGDGALALSWLGTREALPLLLREAQDPQAPEHVLAEVAVALGRLGQVGATGTLGSIAKDERRSEAARALAIVALGLVLDPEPRPSLLKIVTGCNYPARTSALHELLTIL